MFRVVVLHVPVVGLSIAVADHGDAPSKSLFDEQIHVRIGDKIERDVGGLLEGIPRVAGQGVIPSRVQFVGLHCCLPKVLEYISEQENVRFQV